MSLLGTLLLKESGGQNIANTSATTSSGQAQGYFQITQGTWGDYGGYQYAPTPLQATYEQQAAVAGTIPLNRWAPSTIAALRTTGAVIDPSQTLGANLGANGESFADFNPGTGQLAQGPVNQSSGLSAGSGLSSDPSSTGGVATTNQDFSTFSGAQGFGTGNAAATAENAAATAAASASFGVPTWLGIEPGVATAISAWLTGAEGTATSIASGAGTKFNEALKSAQTAVGTFFGGIENWFVRAGLFVLGIVLIVVALIAIAWDHGGKTVTQTVARAAAA